MVQLDYMIVDGVTILHLDVDSVRCGAGAAVEKNEQLALLCSGS